MLFYYIRHGDPIYNPDSLTPLGERQAEAVAKRLSIYGLDEIYASTSNRAIQTATPTAEVLKKEIKLLDFANECHAYDEFTLKENGNRLWVYQSRRLVELFNTKEIRNLGDEWYSHEAFKETKCQQGIERIYRESDAFFKELGYEHLPYTGRYKVINSNQKRIGMFAHHGFGMAFLSAMLDIPYPMMVTHFNMSHSAVTIINFEEENGIAIPMVYSLSNDSHLYKDGLPTNYNNAIRI